MALKVGELRAFLSDNGYSGEELANMSKTQLKDAYEKVNDAVKALDGVTETSDNVGEAVKETGAPDMGDPEWTDYVLGLFVEKELDNGSPKVDALRRVAYKLLGPFNSRTNVVQAPDLDGRATVVVTLEFSGASFQYPTIVDGAADVSTVNTQREFAVHAVATAETRAEGRALRKALKLTKVLAAEELQNADADEANGSDGRIPTSMISSLKMMCANQNVDLERLAEVKFGVMSPEDLTLAQGRQLSTTLFKYKKLEEEIPDEIKTF